ncbi:hypothetical protein FACS1894105_14420 [Clostridia bacterium]|nr:hypothetical protein FACS1894105_14420 [Clostridia bacterium]
MADRVLKLKVKLTDAKTYASEVFGDLDFKVSFTSSKKGFAERGSRTSSALAGPFAGKKDAYCKIDMSFTENGETTNLTLSEDTGGLMKIAMLGVAKREFDKAVDNAEKALLKSGVLV